MNGIARGKRYLYLFIFLYSFILIAGSDIQIFAQEQASQQKYLEITVLDKDSDEPIAGAKVNVRVVQEGGGDLRKESLTDENGKCSFPIEDKNIMFLRLDAIKNGHTPIQMSLPSAQNPQLIQTQHTVYLGKGMTIGGLVQDELGTPIEGVTVSISVQSSNRNDTAVVSGHEEKTDSNGVWTCSVIPEQPERISIRFIDPNYRSELLNVQYPSPVMQMLQERTHVLIMQNQLNLTGHVLDTFGEPIEGALVAQGANRGTIYYPSTNTDSKGFYIFENIKPGEMVLTVQAEGYSPETIRFMVEKQMSPIIFRLEPGHTVTGQVVDPNGRPIPDVAISAASWRELRSLSWQTKTDSNGVFVWNDAPADEVMLNVYKRRYIIIQDYVVKPLEQAYVITLLPELFIHGKIYDANSGETVNNFSFYPGVEGGEGQDVSWKSGLRIADSNEYEFRFTYPSDEYYIRVEAEGYESSVSRAITPEEGDVVLDFNLQKLVPVTGIVVDPNGQPLADAEVMIVTRQLRVLNGIAGTRLSSDKLSVNTDSDGKFNFFPEQDDYSVVILHDKGYAFAVGIDLESNGNITLSAWSKLEGTLKIADKSGVNETIIYNSKTVPQLNGVIFDFQAQTDSEGHFVFDRIFSGEGTVARLLRSGSDLQLNTHIMQVNANPGETQDIQIGGTGRAVTGKIIIPDQIRNRTAWQYIEGNLTINSDNNPYIMISFNINNDGSFRIEDVPEGEYLLYVQAYDLNTRISQMSNEQIATLSQQFSVPELPSGRSDEALELGELELVITGQASANQTLIGKAIPGFEDITMNFSEENLQGKSLLVCFWDYQQRPSRNCILELNKKAKELKEKNIEVIAVQIAKIEKETLDNWLAENEITLNIGTAGDNESKVRYEWAVKYLPWMVLTDYENEVIDEGFGINELDEKIQKVKEKPEEILPDFI